MPDVDRDGPVLERAVGVRATSRISSCHLNGADMLSASTRALLHCIEIH